MSLGALSTMYKLFLMMRTDKYSILAILLGALVLMCTAACSNEEEFTTERGAIIGFSSDTIQFDTVFTTIGSSTKTFVVYNHNDKGVRLKNVRLKEASSGFRLNLDGQHGTSFDDVELYGGDSLFCFVEVTVGTQGSDLPVLVSDEILFTLESGVQQSVALKAYGQDAVILHDPNITENTTYADKRPYLIYGGLTIGEGATLTLGAGTRLYFHADAGIDCNGTLYADGAEGEITLRGDRLDKMFWYLPYDRLDNQWQGICLNTTSTGNYLNNVDIHGGSYGIRATGGGSEAVKLTMRNSVVHNVGGSGLYLEDCNAIVGNSQISNCRGNCVEVVGGSYVFDFCTVAQFCPWIAERGNALNFSNGSNGAYIPLQRLSFTNCLITGYAKDEIYGSTADGSDAVFNFQFKNCVLDTPEPATYAENFIDCTYQTEEQSDNFRTFDTDNFMYDFRLSESSIARGRGTAEGGLLDLYPTDRLGTVRSNTSVDAGCYQYQ